MKTEMKPPGTPSAVRVPGTPLQRRRGHALFRHLFVPAVLALSVASWIFHDAGAQLLAASSVRIDFTSVLLLVSLAVIWTAEQVYPQNPEWNYHLLADGARGWRGWGNLGRDLLYLVVLTQVTALLIRLASSQLEPVMTTWGFGFGSGGPLWPGSAPFAVRVLLAFLVVEFFSYWMHRAAHRWAFLWRFHSTHHVVTELTALKALRTHPLDNLFFYAARNVPLLLLGAGAEELIAAVFFGATLSLLAHANVDVSERHLGLVVTFPRYHAVHHSSALAESHSNFGCHTILWDRVFGTFRSVPQGILVLGVHPVGKRSLWQELVWPLYRAP